MDANHKYGAVVTDSFSKQIAERIRESILDGRLKVGERLPTEEELSRRFGVSRATIREALKRLAAQSLIHSRRGPSGGNFVIHPDPASVGEILTGSATILVSMGVFAFDEIVAARLEMSAICCRLAARHRTEEDLHGLRCVLDEQQVATISDEQFCATDVRFHRGLVNAAKNGPLRFVMYAMVEAMVPITNMVIFRVRERSTIIGFHEEILHAVEEQREDDAVNSLRGLITYLSERYREAMARQQRRRAPPDDGTDPKG